MAFLQCLVMETMGHSLEGVCYLTCNKSRRRLRVRFSSGPHEPKGWAGENHRTTFDLHQTILTFKPVERHGLGEELQSTTPGFRGGRAGTGLPMGGWSALPSLPQFLIPAGIFVRPLPWCFLAFTGGWVAAPSSSGEGAGSDCPGNVVEKHKQNEKDFFL